MNTLLSPIHEEASHPVFMMDEMEEEDGTGCDPDNPPIILHYWPR